MNVRKKFGRSIGVAPLLALAMAAAAPGVAHAENMAAKFIRIDPEPGSVEKTGTPVINMLVEVGTPVPITSYQEGCFAGGKGNAVTAAALSCMSDKIEKEGYEKQFEFPSDNAIVAAQVGDDQYPMPIESADAFKDAQASNAGIAWLILLDASSSLDVSRLGEEQDAAEQIIKAMGGNDAVQVKVMDDKAVRFKSKWLPAASKNKAIDVIRQVGTKPLSSAGAVDALISRLEKESISSFQELFKDGVSGSDSDTTPLMQAIVLLSDGGDTSASGFAGGEQALVAHDKLVKGDLGISDLVKLPMPVVSLWFPDPKLTGGIENFNEVKANNAYQWMSNIATPEVGGYFDILQAGQAGKGPKIAKVIRSRFDNMYYVQARASCLSPSGTQTFSIAFQDTKSKIVPDQWKNVGIDPNYFGKWLLDIDKKKTEAAANAKPVQPGDTFEVYGDFCWGGNVNEAEAYFVTQADAPDIKKASEDKTGAKGKTLLQSLSAKGQRAEVVSVTPNIARFKVPNTPTLFDNQGDSFNLNLVVYDNKQKRVSALDQKGVILLRAQRAPVNKLLIVGAIGGGVVLILLIAILARSGGGGNGRAKRRRGGGPPAPGPMPGQPPGPPQDFAFAGATDAPAAGVPVVMRPASPGMPPLPPMAAPAALQTAVAPNAQPPVASTAYAPSPGPPSGFAPGGVEATFPPNAPKTALAPAPAPAPAYVPFPATAPAPAQPLPPMHAQPLSPQQKAATSFPTTCPNPACRRQVMVPPGGSAQCAFCGTLVDARGAASGAIVSPGYGLTGHVDPNAAQRAVQNAGAPRQPAGGTVALQGTAPMTSSIVLSGPAGTFKILPGIEARIGRDGTQCTIALAEPRISGVHATLKLEGATLMVRDDRSHNGTFVNGNRIPPGTWTPVPAGSQLRFGPIEFGVRVES